MKKLLFTLLLLFPLYLFAHSVQVGYCFNCNGDLRIWVEHWHGSEDPSTTTMTLDVTINGVTTQHVGAPSTSVLNTSANNLPGCTGSITIFGSCPNEANYYNDWVAYDFPSMPTGIPISITIISGNTVFTEDGCGMYPASTGIIIIPPPPAYPDIISCGGPGFTVPEITAPTDNYWTNSNPSIGIPASGNGNIPAFTPVATNLTQTATITMSNTCGTTTFDIIIKPKPTSSFNISNVSDVMCHNEQPVIFMESSASTPGESLTNYYWDLGDGTFSANAIPPSHTYSDPGIYTVSLIVTSSNDCTDSTSITVTIHPMPSADFTTNSVCLGVPVTVTDQSSLDSINGNSITVWNWNYGNGQSNPSYTSEGIYDISLVVITNNGCKDSVSKTVEVWPLPKVNFSPTDVCLNFATQFSDNSTISNAHTSNSNIQWDWDFADGNTSNSQNPSHTYALAGIYNVILTVTSNNGCVNDTTLVVTVYPLPVASFTGINLEGCSPICPEITSTSTVDSPSIINQHIWTLSDGRTYNGTSISDCYENLTGYDISYGLNLKVVTDAGCEASHIENSYIMIYHNPIANFHITPINPDVINNKVTFHNTSSYADYYLWNIDTYGPTSDVNPIIEFPLEPEKYYVQLVAYTNYGCTDTIKGLVNIADRVIFYVPNTFTPDNDNYNEEFTPAFASGYDPHSYTLFIYDRWGEVLFESHDVNKGWNGTYGPNLVKTGTYVWKIEFKETMTDRHHSYTGHVNLLK